MTVQNIPPRLAVDANGYVWRVYEDGAAWSMAPTNPDNSPIPQPVTYYEPVTNPAEPTGELRADMIAALPGVYPWGDAVDRLLAGPLAPLLAKLRAVEELADEEERHHSPAAADRIRRALAGER